MPNKIVDPSLRYSYNQAMLWAIRITAIVAVMITALYFAYYFAVKSHRQEVELNNLKQNAAFLPTEFGILKGEK